MLRAWLFLALILTTCGCEGALAEVLAENVTFDKATNRAELKGNIKGDTSKDYLITAKKGQTLKVDFTTSNSSSYFNIMKANADEAIFTGSISGTSAKISIPDEGTYAVRVYLMRNASRRNEAAKYSLKVALQGSENSAKPKAGAKGFERNLELQGIRFSVTGTPAESGTQLSITPKGLKVDNTPVKRVIAGAISGAEVADLNADGSPEIYVYTQANDSKNSGGLVAYSANKLKSLTEIHLPSQAQDKKAFEGYNGHDEFTVLEGCLGRRFPVASAPKKSSQSTKHLRQIQYKLVPGEATWQLKVDKITDLDL